MDNENKELKASTVAKREKKKERRETKAARKEANKVEEKKSRPNNVILAVMIFGVLIAMFAVVKGYTFFSKAATIEDYIANNGGEETYGSMVIDEYTTANITAEKNSMKIVMDSTIDEAMLDTYKAFYESEDGQDQVDYIAAYFLTTMKPETRAFSADASVTVNVNGEEVASTEMTYKEAKKYVEDLEKEASEEAETEDAENAEEDAAAEEDASEEDAAAEEETAEDGE